MAGNKKAKAVLSNSFVENHKNVTVQQASDLVIESELKLKALREEVLNNERLRAAQQIVKDLRAGYTSAAKYEQAKIAFLLERIEEADAGTTTAANG